MPAPTSKTVLLAVALFALGTLAFAPRRETVPEAARKQVTTIETQNGIWVAVTVSMALADEKGYLHRVVSVASRDDDDEIFDHRSVYLANPSIDADWPCGGGRGDLMVTARPREGLTWGEVDDEDDLTIRVERD